MAIGKLEFLHIAKKKALFSSELSLENGIINTIEIFSKQFEINADPLLDAEERAYVAHEMRQWLFARGVDERVQGRRQ